MKPLILLAALFAAMTLGSLATGAAQQTALFLGPGGDDANPGTLSRPFATLERARDALRALKKQDKLAPGGAVVWLQGGVYSLKQTFELTAEDSGTAEAPITYAAVPGAEVRLLGGQVVTGWRAVSDPAIITRLPAESRSHVLEADLPAQGISDFGELKPRGMGRPGYPAALELFFQDKPMQLARWPNEGWVKIAGVPAGPKGGKFAYSGDRPRRWTQAKDIWVHGYWTWDWADSYERVKAIDLDARVIETAPPHGVYGYKKGHRFYALNLLEELDAPGEWYLDRQTGRLYFWPPAKVAAGRPTVSVLETLISLKNTKHVAIRGLTLEAARGTAVVMQGGAENRIADCRLRNLGNKGVTINGGDHNIVSGCDIYQTGDGGIVLAGGARKTLTAAHNEAINNHIHDYSLWTRTYRPAIAVSGVGNRVAHNLIHDAPHMGILLSGNEHVIEFNELHHVCMETDDVGAFYMGRDWTQRGNIVRFNYFHDLGGHGGVGTMAVYLDDWSSGTLVYGNVCYKAGRAVLIGGGRNNTVENNIFVDCTPAVHVDSRGLGWAKYYFDGSNNTLVDRMKAMNATEPPYSKRYPELTTLYQDQPALAKYNKIVRNISVGGRWLDLRDGLTTKIVEVKDNLVGEDPHFVDAAKQDFRLQGDSPAFKLGFKPIPFEKIGLQRRQQRRSSE